MSGKVTEIAEMNLSGSKDGKITVTTIEEPYGAGSDSVVSIGIALHLSAACIESGSGILRPAM